MSGNLRRLVDLLRDGDVPDISATQKGSTETAPGPGRARARAILWSGRKGMTVSDRIEIDAKVMLGKPVIHGTRIPVELILRKLAEARRKRSC